MRGSRPLTGEAFEASASGRHLTQLHQRPDRQGLAFLGQDAVRIETRVASRQREGARRGMARGGLSAIEELGLGGQGAGAQPRS